MYTGNKTLRDVLEDSALLYGSRTALSMIEGGGLTYDQLYYRARSLSGFLHERGIHHGDRVALLGENMPNWGVAFLAVAAMGAVAVPILPDFHPSDIARIIRHAGAGALLISRRLFGKIAELAPGDPGTIILLDDLTVVDQTDPNTSPESSNTKRLPALPAQDGPFPSSPSPDDLAAIVYTSGTTGYSKGVMLTHENFVSDARGTLAIVDVNQEDRLLSILPLPHTYECTLGFITPVMIGASVYYMDKPPTAAILLPALEKIKPTIMLSVPLVIEKIYKGKVLPELTRNALLKRLHSIPLSRSILHRIAGKKLLRIFGGRLRVFTIGGAPLAPDVELFLREARFPYAIGYGLTETAPLVAGTPPGRTRFRSTGPALPGASLRIADPNPVTGEGEIQIKGPMVMKGYYRDPDRTREAFTDDGWLRTGDLGVLERDGYLYIKGRSKNMILGPSGKNIYPEEIESIINEFESVQESVVFAQGNRLVALVHLDYERLQQFIHSIGETDFRAKVNSILTDLQKQINSRVPLYARIHKIVEHEEPFQKTPTQKIKRHLYVPAR